MSATGTPNAPQAGTSSQPAGPPNFEQAARLLFDNIPHLINLAREGKMAEPHRRQLLLLLTVVTQQPQRFPQYAHSMSSILALQDQLAQETDTLLPPTQPPPPPMNSQNAFERQSPADSALASRQQTAQAALTPTPTPATQPTPQS